LTIRITKLHRSIVAIAVLFVLLAGGTFLNAALIDFYKKGPIVMKSDPEYAGLDYESLFYDAIRKMAVAPDGSIFVSNCKQHNIYKFKDGKLVKTFGQFGEGPSDLYYPGEIAILDNKYVAIVEGNLNMRISLFDLDGIFVKVIRTNYPTWEIAALGNNKIAILTWNVVFEGNYSIKKVRVIIKDILTGKDFTVLSYDEKPEKRVDEKKIYFRSGLTNTTFYLFNIGEGNLLFAHSDSPEISIYTSEGKKVNSFRIVYGQKKVTDAMKDEFRQIIMLEANRNRLLKESLKTGDWSNAFPEWAPYFRNIAVDSENNILVFEHNGFQKITECNFKAYSKEGTYLGESKIQFGVFEGWSDFSLIFFKDCLYSFLQRRDTEDTLMQFVKIKTK